MNWWTRWRRRAALDRDLDRELQDQRGAPRPARWSTPALTKAKASRQAALEIGGVEQVKEAVRDVRGTRWAHDVAQDVRYGVRGLLQAPRPGRGGDVVDRPGHRRQHRDLLAGRRGAAARAAGARPARRSSWSAGSWTNPIWEEVQRRGRDVLRWRARVVATIGSTCRPAARPMPVDGLFVSGGFFETWASSRRWADCSPRPTIGGAAAPTARRLVISHALLAAAAIGGDPAVLGRTLLLDRRAGHDRRRRAGAVPRPDGRPARSTWPFRSARSTWLRPGAPAKPARRPLARGGSA